MPSTGDACPMTPATCLKMCFDVCEVVPGAARSDSSQLDESLAMLAQSDSWSEVGERSGCRGVRYPSVRSNIGCVHGDGCRIDGRCRRRKCEDVRRIES